MDRWACYIEEYMSANGLGARLRDKKTNKKVSIQIHGTKDKLHFLRFLSAAKQNRAVMPGVFDRNGDDIIAVYGTKQKEDEETIFVDTDINGGGYLYE